MSDNIQCCFERYEQKYFVTDAQREFLLAGMKEHTQPDAHPIYTICNLYCDTPDWQLIRTSVEKPDYKEKLRIRSYGTPDNNTPVFVEIKKKYNGVVYKRRITMPCRSVKPFLQGNISGDSFGQIGREIEWFQHVYQSEPRVFIAYDREAYAGIEDPEFRVTFDRNMRWRDSTLDLRFGDQGSPIIDNGRTLMEVKLPGTCPLWFSRLLSEASIFPVSFSKYGTVFTDHILPDRNRQNLKEVLYSA